MIGIIGGSGFYELIEEADKLYVHTPYGQTSTPIEVGKISGKDIAFIARHGEKHNISPSKVPYKANIYAFKELGIKKVITVSAVGSLREDYKPGDLVSPNQFIDFTKRRDYSFYNGSKVAHIPMADPFCPILRKKIKESANNIGLDIKETGTYTCIEGPRFSTRAESIMFRKLGGDIIGMTLIPEIILAREAGMCYANISMVTDYDAWTETTVDVESVIEIFKNNVNKVDRLIREVISKVDEKEECKCQHYINNSFV